MSKHDSEKALTAFLEKVVPHFSKGVFYVLTGGNEFLMAAPLALADLISQKIGNSLEARKMNRLIERVADELLNSIYTHDLESIRKDDATRHLAIILENILTELGEPELYVDIDFDSHRLGTVLKVRFGNEIQKLTVEEQPLVKQFIDQLSDQIVQVALLLKPDEPRLLAEVLKRETQIIGKVEKLRSRMEEIHRSVAGQPSLDSKLFESSFRSITASKMDQLRLFGVDSSQSATSFRLSIAYISLNVRVGLQSLGMTKKIGVEESLIAYPRLVVRGEAGAGKTTILQWLSVSLATNDFPQNLAEFEGILPLYIRLRDYSNSSLPDIQDIPSRMMHPMGFVQNDVWFWDLLDRGKFILMLDGIDELPDRKRGEIKDWLTPVLKNFPNIRVVVTGRPSSIDEAWLSELDFIVAEVETMTIPEIESFIHHWYRAYSESHGLEDQLSDAIRLVHKVRDTSSLRQIAINPLLCAIICALNVESDIDLPTRRVELYEACVRLLLEKRDSSRGVEIDNLKLSYDQKSFLIEKLAFHMLKSGAVTISKGDALEYLGSVIDKTVAGLSPNLTQDMFLDTAINRWGILREPVIDLLDFPHRSFQDFLAAKAIQGEKDTALLVNHVLDDRWRETTLFLAGITKGEETDDLIDRLIKKGDRAKQQRGAHLVCAACLETVKTLSPNLIEKINKRVSRLVPPQSREEANLLSKMGDISVPFLGPSESLSDEEASYCVDILLTIGSEISIETLTKYLPEYSELIVDNLDRDRLLDIQHLFSVNLLISSLETCSSSSFRHLEEINKFLPNLRFASVVGDDVGTNKAALDGIEKLRLIRRSGRELAFNENMRALTALSIEDCGFEKIYICENDKFDALEIINCRNLSELQTAGKISSVSFVDQQVTDLLVNSVRNCSTLKLEKVRLKSSFLSNFQNLDVLELADIELRNDLDFSSLWGLKELRMSGTWCESINLNVLFSLEELRTLIIPANVSRTFSQKLRRELAARKVDVRDSAILSFG